MSVKLIGPQPGAVENVPLPFEIIKGMVKNYSENLGKTGTDILNAGSPSQLRSQPTSAWVSWHELQQLMEDNDANGIRIYFGQHTSFSAPAGREADYKDLLTIILVATKDSQNPDMAQFNSSVDQLTVDADPAKASSVSFAGQADDQFPICKPTCPPGGMIKILV